jgi:hypothetical protein
VFYILRYIIDSKISLAAVLLPKQVKQVAILAAPLVSGFDSFEHSIIF